MNPRQTKRENLAAALDAAHADSDLKTIARESTIPYGSLRNFRSHGHIGDDKAALLEDWLRTRGYLTGNVAAPTQIITTITADDPLPQAAALLRTLADLIANPALPRTHRAALLHTQITALQTLAALLTTPADKPKP